MRQAKIVSTIGPASNKVEILEKMIVAGLDVARVNMSHGTHEMHKDVIGNIRKASKNMKKEVAILLDLQGPKIRVDKLEKELVLKEGEEWVVGLTEKRSDYLKYKNYIPTTYENLVEDCHDGAQVLFDDGLIVGEAISRDNDVYRIKIKTGGVLKQNKGINLPDCIVTAHSFTEKDKKDLLFGLENDIDYVALSFVRKKEDVEEVKLFLKNLNKFIPIISKIESPQAIDNIEKIIDISDAIMVARGDMGVELGNHRVPAIQKNIINICNEKAIPVITATQMLETMIENVTPTRAEASDVANAIWDGTDAVMLSGETAMGRYPVKTIEMMVKIIKEAEKKPKERPLLRNMDLSNVSASIMVAASMIAEKVFASRIISLTESGYSCKMISHFRPKTLVIGVTNSQVVSRRMCLYWGVEPFYVPDYDKESFDFNQDVVNRVKNKHQIALKEKIVLTKGDGEFFAQGSSNSVRVTTIKEICEK